MALIDLTTAKEHLRIPATKTDYDSLVTRLIDVASKRVESVTRRKFEAGSYTKVYDARGQNEIILLNPPVTAVSSVRIDSARSFGADTEVDSSRYSWDEDGILRFHSRLGYGSKIVQVTYDAGFSTIPPDIVQATLIIVEYLYKQTGDSRVGVSSRSKGDENITFIEGLPPTANELLEPYIEFTDWTEMSTRNI